MLPNSKKPESGQTNAPFRYSSKSFWEAVEADSKQREAEAKAEAEAEADSESESEEEEEEDEDEEEAETEAAKGVESLSLIDEEVRNKPTRQPPEFKSIIKSKPLPLPPVERYVRGDGRVGVVLADGLDHGWSTHFRLLLDARIPSHWPKMRSIQEIALFDKDIVAAVVAKNMRLARKVAAEKMEMSENFCPLNTNLRVEWLAPGEEFEVREPAARETVKWRKLMEFWRA